MRPNLISHMVLSRPLGKSEKDIQDRLTEFYKQEKLKEKTMKFNPFFSNLLQSRAALLQADNSQAKRETIPLLPSNFLLRSSQHSSVSVAAQNSADQKPLSTQLSRPAVEKPTPSEAKAVPAPSAHTDRRDKIPDANRKMSVKETTSTQPSVLQPVKEISFPLVRSKSGRIILPSSLKPSKSRPPDFQLTEFNTGMFFSFRAVTKDRWLEITITRGSSQKCGKLKLKYRHQIFTDMSPVFLSLPEYFPSCG